MSQAPDPRLAIDFCGLRFATPLVLLSGCVGFGEEYTRVEGFSNRDAGALCLKGTTLEPRLGNAPHRIRETTGGLLNAIGLQNPGVDHVVNRILPTLDFTETRFIANVSGGTVEEYYEVTRRFDDSPIDAIEINISCPNVKQGGVAFGNDRKMSAQVVTACRSATAKPLITKLSPNQTDIAANARACLEAGSDAFAVINTLMGMAIDSETRTPILDNRQGGLSGPAIKPIALLKVHQVYQVCRPHGAPIIGDHPVAVGREGSGKFSSDFVSLWLCVRKNVEHYTGFTHSRKGVRWPVRTLGVSPFSWTEADRRSARPGRHRAGCIPRSPPYAAAGRPWRIGSPSGRRPGWAFPCACAGSRSVSRTRSGGCCAR